MKNYYWNTVKVEWESTPSGPKRSQCSRTVTTQTLVSRERIRKTGAREKTRQQRKLARIDARMWQ
jgi:hypothetical protein